MRSKYYTPFQQTPLKWIPRSKLGASKSRPLWAADTRIGNVWEYHLPPPPGAEVISWENQWWHQKMSLNCSLFSHVNLPTILLLMIIRSLAYCSYHHTLYKAAFTLGAQVRSSLCTNVNAPFFFKYHASQNSGTGTVPEYKVSTLFLDTKVGTGSLSKHNFCKFRAVHCFVVTAKLMFQNGV